jgi:hypothetical protein
LFMYIVLRNMHSDNADVLQITVDESHQTEAVIVEDSDKRSLVLCLKLRLEDGLLTKSASNKFCLYMYFYFLA